MARRLLSQGHCIPSESEPGPGRHTSSDPLPSSGRVSAGQGEAGGAVRAAVIERPRTTRAQSLLRLVQGDGVFGPTFQGEGPNLGRWTCFVRLYDCNLHCRLCDTKHSWEKSQYPRARWEYTATVDQVLADLDQRMQPRLRQGAPGMVVVSGGEPLMQALVMAELLAACRALGWWTEVETNGTLSPNRLGGPEHWPDQFNVSPKLAHGINRGADRMGVRIHPEAIADFKATDRAVWKFAVADLADLHEVMGWV
jgi:hypothetical protein